LQRHRPGAGDGDGGATGSGVVLRRASQGTTHMRFPSNILHYQEVQVHGSYASRHRDQLHALDMLARDIGGIRRVVSSVVELDAAPDAFASIRAGEVLKVVVAPA